MLSQEGIAELNEIRKVECGVASTFDDRLGASVGKIVLIQVARPMSSYLMRDTYILPILVTRELL